jgi:chromosome segregation ATPase
MKNTKSIISILAILSLIIYIVIHELHDIHGRKIEDSHIDTQTLELDSIFTLADLAINTVQSQRIDHLDKVHDLDDKVHDLDDNIKLKNSTIEHKIIELNKLILEVEAAKDAAEQTKELASIERLEAANALNEYERLIADIKEEKSMVIHERDKLKRECDRLNSLLRNDYTNVDSIVNKLDSSIIAPVVKSKKRGKNRGNNRGSN